MAYAWAGDQAVAQDLMNRMADDFPDRVGRIGRQEGVLLQLVKEFSASPPPPVRTADDYWPTAGGGPSRTRLIKSDAVVSAKLWELSFNPSLLSGGININQQMGQRHKESGYLLAFSPIGADGILYFHDDQKVWAIRAASGHEVFTTSPRSKQRELDRLPQYRHEPPPMFVPTLDGDRLYVRLRNGGRPAGRVPATRGALTELLCLNRFTGQLQWRINPAVDLAPAELEDVRLDTSPLVAGDQLLAVGRRSKSFGFEDSFLLSFDKLTGDYRWHVHLASAATGWYGASSPTLNHVAAAGGHAYVTTNLGAVACVDLSTGIVRWLRRYPRIVVKNTRVVPRRDISRGITAWQYSPTLVSDGRVICMPLDSTDLLVLDAQNGDVLHRKSKEALGGADTLMGGSGASIFLSGAAVVRYDLSKDQIIWQKPLINYGAAFLAADRLFVPTVESLQTFDWNGMLTSSLGWDGYREGGNIVVFGDIVVVAGSDRLSGYARWEVAEQHLRARIAEATDDPERWLDLAEVAFLSAIGLPADRRDKRLGLAHEALQQGVDTAGGFAVFSNIAIKQRLFSNCIRYADALAAEGDNENAIRLYRIASLCPPDTKSHVIYRVRLARIAKANGDQALAVDYYQEIIADPSLRNQPYQPDGDSQLTVRAGTLAEAWIDLIIRKEGRQFYAKHDAQARESFDSAMENRNREVLAALLEEYPNSDLAPEARMAQAQLSLDRGDYDGALGALRSAWVGYGSRLDSSRLCHMFALCYVYREQPQRAAVWVRRLLDIYAGDALPRFKLGDGTDVNAVELLEQLRSQHVASPGRLSLSLPLRVLELSSFHDQVELLNPQDLSDDSNGLLLFYGDGMLRALEVDITGELIPKKKFDFPLNGPVVFLGSDEHSFFFRTASDRGRNDQQLIALSRNDGTVRWKYRLPSLRPAKTNQQLMGRQARRARATEYAAALLGETIVAIGHDELFIIEKVQGHLRARLALGGRFDQMWTGNDEFLAITLQDGAENRRIDVFDLYRAANHVSIAMSDKASPQGLTVSPGNQLVVVHRRVPVIYDLYDGSEIASIELVSEQFRAETSIENDRLYLLTTSLRVHAFSLLEGRALWTSPQLNNPETLKFRIRRATLGLGRSRVHVDKRNSDVLVLAGGNAAMGINVENGELAWRAVLDDIQLIDAWGTWNTHVALVHKIPKRSLQARETTSHREAIIIDRQNGKLLQRINCPTGQNVRAILPGHDYMLLVQEDRLLGFAGAER